MRRKSSIASAARRGAVFDRALDDAFFGQRRLTDVHAPATRHVFCATELQSGHQCFLAPEVLTEWNAGEGTPGDVRLATAVRASAALPLAFPPVELDLDRLRVHLARPWRPKGEPHVPVRNLVLTDGGVYDNMGLEPVWKDHAAVLVSDASPTFKYQPGVFGVAWNGLRYGVTLLEQSTDVRKRWLISSFLRGEYAGAYWGIASMPGHYGYEPDFGYSEELIRDCISQVRIDFDSFSEGEIRVLENHGYVLAEIAMRTHAKELVDGPWPDPQVPHEYWMNPDRAREALAQSAETKILGRFR
jgi:NTE family protein